MKPTVPVLIVLAVSNAFPSGQMLKSLYASIGTLRLGLRGVFQQERIFEVSSFEWVQGRWEKVGHQTSDFNDQGVPLKRTQEIGTPQSGIEITETQFSFNDDFVLTGVRQRKKVDAIWEDAHQPLFIQLKYTRPDGMPYEVSNSWDDSGKISSTRTESFKNEDNTLFRQEWKTYENGKWVVSNWLEVESDSKGRTTKQVFNNNGGDLPQTSLTSYVDSAGLCVSKNTDGTVLERWKYNENGQITRKEDAIWIEDHWFITSTVTHVYAGRELKESIYAQTLPDSDSPVEITRQTFFGNSNSLVDTTVHSRWHDDSGWISTSMNTTEKDTRMNVTTETFFTFHEGQWIASSRSKHHYDNQNHRLQTDWEIWNDTGELIQTKSMTYDTLGRITSEWILYGYPEGPVKGHRHTFRYWEPSPILARSQNRTPLHHLPTRGANLKRNTQGNYWLALGTDKQPINALGQVRP